MHVPDATSYTVERILTELKTVVCVVLPDELDEEAALKVLEDHDVAVLVLENVTDADYVWSCDLFESDQFVIKRLLL